jgi:hypothetical protein
MFQGKSRNLALVVAAALSSAATVALLMRGAPLGAAAAPAASATQEVAALRKELRAELAVLRAQAGRQAAAQGTVAQGPSEPQEPRPPAGLPPPKPEDIFDPAATFSKESVDAGWAHKAERDVRAFLQSTGIRDVESLECRTRHCRAVFVNKDMFALQRVMGEASSALGAQGSIGSSLPSPAGGSAAAKFELTLIMRGDEDEEG